jgi:hypothetical protein
VMRAVVVIGALLLSFSSAPQPPGPAGCGRR